MSSVSSVRTTRALVEVPDETYFNSDQREYVRGTGPDYEATIYSRKNNSYIGLGEFVLARRAEATLEEGQAISLDRIASALERIADRLDSITGEGPEIKDWKRMEREP